MRSVGCERIGPLQKVQAGEGRPASSKQSKASRSRMRGLDEDGTYRSRATDMSHANTANGSIEEAYFDFAGGRAGFTSSFSRLSRNSTFLGSFARAFSTNSTATA